MEWFDINCSECGYEQKLVLGTPSPEESFDLNEDFSHYVPVVCKGCKSIMSLDAFDKQTTPACSCGGESTRITEEEMHEIDCPKCSGRNLAVNKIN